MRFESGEPAVDVAEFIPSPIGVTIDDALTGIEFVQMPHDVLGIVGDRHPLVLVHDEHLVVSLLYDGKGCSGLGWHNYWWETGK